MNDFIAISLSSTMKKIFEPIEKLKKNNEEKEKYLKMLKNKEERTQYLSQTTEELEKKKSKYNRDLEYYQRDLSDMTSIHNTTQGLSSLMRIDEDNLSINWTKNQIEKMGVLIEKNKNFLTNDDLFIKEIQSIIEEINSQIEKLKNDLYTNIKPSDISVVISGTKLEKDMISKWAEEEYFFKKLSAETKEKVVEFVEELWNQGKIFQPRRDNLINLDSWGPFLPVSGIFTPEEFKEVTKDMLSSEQAIVRNLETFKKLFPEQFPPHLSAIEVFNKYAHHKDNPERRLLETFDNAYKTAYPYVAPMSTEYTKIDQSKFMKIIGEVMDIDTTSVENQVLNGTTPVSFTTPSSEDKTK